MEKVKILSCAVLSHDLDKLCRETGISADREYLEAGLHEEPARLKKELQGAVDRASEGGRYGRIVIGYGLCGLSTVGLKARSVPLAIPRVHDCIALFLGSEKRYREQFSRNPGTLYMSRGWYENKTQPRGIRKKEMKSAGYGWGLYEGYGTLREKYGEENAREIGDFLNSWQKNYTRSVYISTGLEEDSAPYEDYARDIAGGLGLAYEKIDGSDRLFRALLTAGETSDEVLFVPPSFVTGYDPLNRGLFAYHGKDKSGRNPWDRPAPPSRAGAGEERSGLGLGIDAGGTYTDAVLYDYRAAKVLARGKAPTTPGDYSRGIGNALSSLPAALLQKADLTVVSTTLATNAVVEKRYRKVGLLVMPLGKESGENLPAPWRRVRGRLSIQGEEIEPVDEGEIRRVAAELRDREKVEAFAVSGYGSTVNREHEKRIRDILIAETGMGVCCGHELSSRLNFYHRANTAVLNGGIIPLLEEFISDLEKALTERGIGGKVMMVRGDGSLMSREKAVTRPIETALSGPAASVAGARYLTGLEDLLVIDVGGTTSDIGLVGEGRIKLTEEGARVGDWRTHVKAVDMSTLGTGGDSRILLEQRRLTVGPRRLIPVARLSGEPGWEETLAYMETLPDPFFRSTAAMEVLAAAGGEAPDGLSGDEKAVLAILAERPRTLRELALEIGHGLWHLVCTENLEKRGLIRRYGLTPTDILIARGKVELWDALAAQRVLRCYEEVRGGEGRPLEKEVFSRIHRNLMEALLARELEREGGDDVPPGERALLGKILDRFEKSGDTLSLAAGLPRPLVGVGAAAPHLLAETARLLRCDLIIPPDGDVANAVGAVCSPVRVSREGAVQPGDEGRFVAAGGRTAQVFDDFDQACHWLEEELALQVREDALRAGTAEQAILWEAENRIGETAEGTSVFLGRTYRAGITGLPL